MSIKLFGYLKNYFDIWWCCIQWNKCHILLFFWFIMPQPWRTEAWFHWRLWFVQTSMGSHWRLRCAQIFFVSTNFIQSSLNFIRTVSKWPWNKIVATILQGLKSWFHVVPPMDFSYFIHWFKFYFPTWTCKTVNGFFTLPEIKLFIIRADTLNILSIIYCKISM